MAKPRCCRHSPSVLTPIGLLQWQRPRKTLTAMSDPSVFPADVAAIVATVHRKAPLARLLRSLDAQSRPLREVVIVDQNDHALDSAFLQEAAGRLKLVHLHCPPGRGVSWARNIGWRQSDAEWMLFPDDDCWYPPDYLENALDRALVLGTDVLCGRATDPAGRTINGRFAARAARIVPNQVFVSQIEWNTLVRRMVLHATGGYDETISLGGTTPWQGGEGYDLLLRVIALDIPCHYDPAVVAHHDELTVVCPDDMMVCKGRAYGRGLGRVLAVHGFGVTSLAYWVGRSLCNFGLSVLKGQPDRAAYFRHQAVGRTEGWLGKTFRGHAIEPGRRVGPFAGGEPAAQLGSRCAVRPVPSVICADSHSLFAAEGGS